jgi:hypothetical protein
MIGLNTTELLCIAVAERKLQMERFERRRRRGLLMDLPPAPSLRTTLAGWLLRAALRLDARSGESSMFHREPTHA